jgi:hypothetical protein
MQHIEGAPRQFSCGPAMALSPLFVSNATGGSVGAAFNALLTSRFVIRAQREPEMGPKVGPEKSC